MVILGVWVFLMSEVKTCVLQADHDSALRGVNELMSKAYVIEHLKMPVNDGLVQAGHARALQDGLITCVLIS